MMSVEDFIRTLEAYDMPYYVSSNEFGELSIGVPTQNGHVYFWFSVYVFGLDDVMEVTGDENVKFSHRYSRNTGATKKDWKTGYQFMKTLERGRVGYFRKNSSFDHVYFDTFTGLIANRL